VCLPVSQNHQNPGTLGQLAQNPGEDKSNNQKCFFSDLHDAECAPPLLSDLTILSGSDEWFRYVRLQEYQHLGLVERERSTLQHSKTSNLLLISNLSSLSFLSLPIPIPVPKSQRESSSHRVYRPPIPGESSSNRREGGGPWSAAESTTLLKPSMFPVH
jgi:hypothetical protein